MGYNILCYSFSQKSDADSVTNDCRAAFGLPAQTAARSDGKYQVEVTGISAESRAYAISAVMSQAKYNTVSGSTLLSYTYSTQNDANLWKNNLQTACGVTATVSAKSGGYQISLSSSNAAAIGRLLGKALYNEVKKEAGSKKLPLRNNYSWNQYHTEVTSAINGSTKGCLYCCALSIANLYGKAYTPQNMAGDFYWNAGGWTGEMPADSKAFINGVTSCSLSTILSSVKSEIDAGRYIVVQMMDILNTPHYVVAYGYTNNAASPNDILVIDSYVKSPSGATDYKQKEGCLITLAKSYSNNEKNRYSGIRLTGTK